MPRDPMNAFPLVILAFALVALAGCTSSAPPEPPVRDVQPATVIYDDSVAFDYGTYAYGGDLGYAYAGGPVFEYWSEDGYGYDNPRYQLGRKLICDFAIGICYDPLNSVTIK